MKKNSLETLERIVANLEEVVSHDYDPNNFQDVDIYKSISILKNKVGYYRSPRDIEKGYFREGEILKSF